MKNLIKRTLLLSTPFILLLLSYMLFFKTESMSLQTQEIIRLSPYAIFLIGMIISWWFNRSRVFFIIIILTLNLFLMYHYASSEAGKTLYFDTVYPIASLLVPLNIAIFSLLKERGILTLWGAVRIGLILSQVLFSFWVIGFEKNDITGFITKDHLAVNTHTLTPLSQLSILAFLAALAILAVRYVLYKSHIDISFTGVLVTIFVILHTKNTTMFASIFTAASGIILLIGIIQSSYSMAFFDELTGLPSRRALEQDMMKLGLKYVIAMLDIDFFKKFNDRYGHDTGDEVLMFVASMIRNVSGGGKAYRYGGEEFTVIFPGKGLKDAVPHLEELRERISKRGFAIRGKDRPKRKPKSTRKSSKPSGQVRITISTGVAERNERHKTVDAVIKAADSALYRAKKKGRNCVSK